MVRACIICLSFALSSAACAEEYDLTQLSLEELMSVKVYAASKYEQSQTDAPSSVSVVTAGEIRAYGWRNLGDLLRAQRGMYLSYDRIYGYLGVRGVLVSGDLNSRLLVNLDGYRISDVVYEQSFILNDFILDPSLIERVEIIRGPSSTLHGATPLLGVINIVSKNPQKAREHLAELGVGSGQWRNASYSFSHIFENDASLVLSVSGLKTNGATLSFHQPPAFSGTTQNTDFEKVSRIFVKYQQGDTKLLISHANRDKGVPTGATGAVFDNPNNHYVDIQNAANLSHLWHLSAKTDLEARVYAGAYDFRGSLWYDQGGAALVNNRDLASGRWQGAELKALGTQGQHTWVAGVEYQNNARQNQKNYDVDGTLYLDDKRHTRRYGIYLQDDWRYTEKQSLTLGLRYDIDLYKQSHVSPRLAWIYRPDSVRTVKLVSSQAYRAPNVAETYYAYGSSFLANLDLSSERMQSHELIFEHALSTHTRYTINPYYLDLNRRISQIALSSGALQYQNTGAAKVLGLELELYHRFQSAADLRASYSRQNGRDEQGNWLTDSPQDMLTLNYTLPLLGKSLRLGNEWQYNNARLTFAGNKTEPILLSNLNLSGQLTDKGASWSVGISNLFNRHFSTPDTPDPALQGRDRIVQDGRSWRATMRFVF